MAGESLKQLANIDVLHVPYKGAAPAITDLMGGLVDYVPMNTIEAHGYIQGQRVRPLAVAAPQRLPHLPNVPTASEGGLKGYDESVWFGLVYPARTPPDIVRRTSTALQQVLGEPAFRQRLVDMGAKPGDGNATQFGEFLGQERRRMERLVKIGNIKAE